MSDYTPNWAEIKIHFVRSATDSTNSIAVMNEHEEMADRWLAQHEAEIAKQTEERIIALLESMNGQGTIQTYVRQDGGHEPVPSTVYIDRPRAIALIKGETK